MSEPLAPVDLILLWHHHQPDYRRPRDGRAVLPWVSLHAAKDYLDMARHLERHPDVRATFNLVPALLDQIEAAASGAPDALYELIARPVSSLSAEERRLLVWRCCQAPEHAIARWPAYRALRDRATGNDGGGGLDLLALEVWFLLGWVDPMFHGEPEAARALADHPRWTERHRDDLTALHRRLAGQVIPAYRALAERGQIELSTSPYHHPILPLLVDFESARRARPELALPGERMAAAEDARWQVERALARHEAVFGRRPEGMWPSEGSVSPEAVALAAACGVRWLASDEAVLKASLPEAERSPGVHYRPWRFEAGGRDVTLFFRDRELSDRIGFVYARWEPERAAADFIAHLRDIGRRHGGDRPPVVSVILDGENCWEHYHDDGNPFLTALYTALADARDIRTRTPSDVVREAAPTARLTQLHSGSWIDSDFHIWIGHAEKNRAWDLLARARRALVDAGITRERSPAAWEALARAEGSDWFWWFGDDHHTLDQAVFDRLFRELVSASYEQAGLAPPAALSLPIARGVTREWGTAPIGLIHPIVDGRLTTFYEWHTAGRFVLDAGGAMHQAQGLVRELHFGFDAERFYLRLDFTADAPPGASIDLALDVVTPRAAHLRVAGLAAGERSVVWADGPKKGDAVPGAQCRVGSLLELGLPFASVGWAPGEVVGLLVQAISGEGPLASYPDEAGLRFTVPSGDFAATMWSA